MKLIVSFGLGLLVTSAVGAETGIVLSDGLSIAHVADDELVPDCTTIAVDEVGRVIASGPGYIRTLVDRDDDGRFDQAIDLATGLRHGAHGLFPENGDLYYVGDGGVWKLSDTDGDGVADSAAERVLEIKTGSEHDAHALRRGPDKFWYLIAGNNTKGMYDLQTVDDPIIPNPRAGAIWRISPDWKEREVWAHGFRNAYDFDFAPDHSIDTFDSDGERDVSLPWYRPTRVYRVRRGDDAGWLTRSWKRPNVDPQMPQVLAELGRGSPTGVLRYRHHRLPKRLHHGVVVLDWTFGRIVVVRRDGEAEVIAAPKGTAGFAVTDIADFPDGRLLVSVGGRRTRGGLYVIDAVEPLASEGVVERLWRGRPNAPSHNETRDRLVRLRDRPEPELDVDAAHHAIAELQKQDAQPSESIAAMTLLIESLGGLGAGNPKDARGKEQVAAVFDSYRSLVVPKLDDQQSRLATAALIRLIQSNREDSDVAIEAVRTLAVIEPESMDAFEAIVADMQRAESPISKLHRLIALARIPVKRSDEMTEVVVKAMLEIPAQIQSLGLNVDRNWTPRLGELFVALERRDSLLGSRLVANPEFGDPSHLVWMERLDPENLERARRKFLEAVPPQKLDPAVARFIAMGDDAVPRGAIDAWLDDPLTRPAAWLAIASHANQGDTAQLRRAALSVDKTVRERAVKALERLGAEVPQRQSNSESIRQWLEKSDSISQLKGDQQSGKALFTLRQCANCHSGAKALGPPLEGISKRFSSEDLLRATVDPSHTVSDRYRARQVLTADDRIVIGMMIYESVDGLTLLTADAKTLRINADDIVEARPSEVSLMPEGLIDGLTDQQVADMIEYMRQL